MIFIASITSHQTLNVSLWLKEDFENLYIIFRERISRSSWPVRNVWLSSPATFFRQAWLQLTVVFFSMKTWIFNFLPDSGVSGVRSMGPGLSTTLFLIQVLHRCLFHFSTLTDKLPFCKQGWSGIGMWWNKLCECAAMHWYYGYAPGWRVTLAVWSSS